MDKMILHCARLAALTLLTLAASVACNREPACKPSATTACFQTTQGIQTVTLQTPTPTPAPTPPPPRKIDCGTLFKHAGVWKKPINESTVDKLYRYALYQEMRAQGPIRNPINTRSLAMTNQDVLDCVAANLKE